MILALKIIKYLIFFLIFISLSIFIFLKTYYQFGGSPDLKSLTIIEKSKNYLEGGFANIENAPRYRIDKNNPIQKDPSLKDWFFPPEGKNPSKPIPSFKFDSSKLSDSKFSWLGHSTVLMNTGGLTIMTDPVFNRASPIPIIGKAFPYENNIAIEDLPKINVIILSHDHYDHLDAKSMKKFSKIVDYFIVPLGVKGHLISWGIDREKITELDWHETENYKGVDFTLTPAQHFSGRSFTDHNKTLWGSWVINSKVLNLYFSGDSGYSNTFKQIGDVYGPFDLAFIECGGYNSNWADVHMFPYEVVQASIDLKADIFIPVSWAKFDLSLHTWKEPIIRVTKEAKKNNIKIGTPMIGEVFNLIDLPTTNWWMAN